MELELKHIAGYLPYSLNIANKSSKGTILEIYFMEEDNNNNFGITNVIYGSNQFPILRPLSDFTKEIEVNGEKIVPIIELAKIGTLESKISITNSNICQCYVDAENTKKGFFMFNCNSFLWQVGKNAEAQSINNQLELFNKLYEWHFDIHELIEKGLAIDINTLES